MRILLALLLTVSVVQAQQPTHRPIKLLDSAGESVLTSQQPVSTQRSCTPCHDVEAISRGYHAQLGHDESVSPAPSQRPWDTGPGLYGRWDSLRHTGLTGGGAPGTEGLADWLLSNAWRHVGGGPGAGSLEVDCFLCHTPRPNRDARAELVQAGRFQEAPSGTLLGTGLVERAEGGLRWRPEGFSQDGSARPELLGLQPPRSEQCTACHGVPTGGQQALWTQLPLEPDALGDEGFVFSGRPVSDSAFNLAGKSELSRPWDVHAARLVSCADCHPPLNAPGSFAEQAGTRPAHLASSPRGPSAAEFLRNPSHDFRKGYASQGTAARRLSGSMRDCRDCHAEQVHASWLPFEPLHLSRLSCQACHVPRVLLPSRRATDWSVPTPDGQPRVEHRGAAGPLGDPATLIQGWQPLLLPRQGDPEQPERLQPTNLQSVFYWVAGDPARPVPLQTLQQVLHSGAAFHDDVLAALDRDGDGALSDPERWLDTAERVELVRSRLEDAGVSQPRLVGELLAQEIHHGAVSGEHAVRDCQACHAPGGRLSQPWLLAERAPAGVSATLVGDATVRLAGDLLKGSEGLVYLPDVSASGLHVAGQAGMGSVDILGLVLLLLTAAGVLGHGALRIAAGRWS